MTEKLHRTAVELCDRYRKTEGALIEILQQVERHRIFLRYGHSSLFQYVVTELKLSEGVAYNLICISRKALEVPELRSNIESGSITLSNARKITPLLTEENKAEWLHKAATLSSRLLEKEIAKIRPEILTPETVAYVTENRVKLELGLSETEFLRLCRTQDLLSQKRKRPVSLEETLVTINHGFLERNDPVIKSERQQHRKKPTEKVETPVTLQGRRRSVPADVLHRVYARDKGQCTFINEKGERCTHSRWIEIHHRVPINQGGKNSVENLFTLCSSHHHWIHQGTHRETNIA